MSRATDLPSKLQHNNLMFDFYSGLLTPKQKEVFSMHFMEDMSMAEIAEVVGISPQAVLDMLKRTKNKLKKFEEQLGLVKKHMLQRKIIAEVKKLTGNTDKDMLIRSLVESML